MLKGSKTNRTAAPLVGIGLAFALPAPALAGTVSYCVTCTDPAQTYLCSVDTGSATPASQALQLFCIVRTSKDGGHGSCSARAQTGGPCDGVIRKYSYSGPAVPEAIKSAAEKLKARNAYPADNPVSGPDTPRQKGGEPETIIELTTRAGGKVRDAAGSAGRAVTRVGKGAGERVGDGARGIGHRVGSAARTAYDCIRSLFRKCGSDGTEPNSQN